MPRMRPATVATAAIAIAATLTTPAVAQIVTGPPDTVAGSPVVNARMIPPNTPARGLIYNGLATEAQGACARAYRIVATGGCTPGPDANFAGFDVAVDVAKLPEREPKVQCDAVSSKRVQVVYARASDTPDRYEELADSIRQWAGQVDGIVRDRAAAAGGERHVSFVHDADCVIDVENVEMDPGADDSFGATIADLAARRLRSKARKYLVFVDANVYCGIAEIEDDDTAPSTNASNEGPHYARIDAGCWSGDVAAHELLHTLGAVQLSAPGSSGDWRCAGHELVIDCDLNDYFNPSPPAGSYLATHWNVARSLFLVRARQDLWGYVAAESSTRSSYTPSLSRQRNSTNALNTVVRNGTGSYTVTFPNLGVLGGTVNVSAMTSNRSMCKVNDWGHALADLEVRVRCHDLTGAAVDTTFTATYARPAGFMPGKRFAYVWADRAGTASYTPDATYSYNSDGRINQITRSATGRYQVRLPGIGGAGGSANVTAYGPGTATCKLVNFVGSGTDELVDVACHTAAGAATDSKFTMTFHGDDGILGVPTDGVSPRAHVLADQPTSVSYTPVLSEQFNATGGTITINRHWPGWYSVRIPDFEMLGGNAQVTALSFTGDSVRCTLNNWSTSWSSVNGSATNVSVRCFSAAGVDVDAPFTVSFMR